MPDRPSLIEVAEARAAARGGTVTPPPPELQDEVYAVRGSAAEGEVLTYVDGRPEWRAGGGGVQIAGDLGGTPAVPTVLTGLFKVVRPSGDATGANDRAAINAALAAGDASLVGDFTINGPIVIPSNRTLLLGGKVTLAAGASCNMLVNSHQDATGNTNIVVKGLGRAIFDGNAINQDVAATGYGNAGVFLVNVHDFSVEDVTLGPMRKHAALQQRCTNGRWSRIHLAQDRLVANQDGIDPGPGCSDIVIENITGQTGDDFCSIFAQGTSSSIHPYVLTLTAAQRSVSNIVVRNVKVAVGINCFRMQAGDGSTLRGVTIDDFHNTDPAANLRPVLKFGRIGYVTTPPANRTDISQITLRGYKGPAKYLIAADSKFSGVHVSDFTIIGDFTRLVGNENDDVFTPTFEKVTIENGRIENSTAAGAFLALAVAGGSCDSIEFRNISAAFAGSLCASGAGHTSTGVHFDNIHIGSVNSAPFRSAVAETGSADRVIIDAYTSTAATQHYITSALKLRLGPTMPVFHVGDAAPVPTAGSIITCKAGKDPTGGGFASAATYIADGTVWNRQLALANDPTF